MNTEDKLYHKIKTAAEQKETQNFPGMDKVWNRVEDKLDAQVSKSESTKWKKIAIAASVLVVGTIVFQFYKTNSEIIVPENKVVLNDTITKIELKNEPQIVSTEESNPIIKDNANEILKEQTQLKQEAVALEEKKVEVKATKIQSQPIYFNNTYEANTIDESEEKIVDPKSIYVTPAKGIKKASYHDYSIQNDSNEMQEKKLSPLVVINGKVSKNGNLNTIPNEEIDSVIVLSEPLYIINGVQYSEEELFGPNPTSPYAPLHKQNIISTTILQEEDALKSYGEKGKKGVVIIQTKDGKPKN